MSNAVFWDTSAFIALANQRDRWHQLARQLNHELAQQKFPRLTTSAILIEVADGLSKIGQRPMAYQLIAAVRAPSPIPTQIIHIDESLWMRGWQLYQNRADKEWGLTDCLSFVVMGEHDKHSRPTTIFPKQVSPASCTNPPSEQPKKHG